MLVGVEGGLRFAFLGVVVVLVAAMALSVVRETRGCLLALLLRTTSRLLLLLLLVVVLAEGLVRMARWAVRAARWGCRCWWTRR